jgi:hypothetical protein
LLLYLSHFGLFVVSVSPPQATIINLGLSSFRAEAEISKIVHGPVVTQWENGGNYIFLKGPKKLAALQRNHSTLPTHSCINVIFAQSRNLPLRNHANLQHKHAQSLNIPLRNHATYLPLR